MRVWRSLKADLTGSQDTETPAPTTTSSVLPSSGGMPTSVTTSTAILPGTASSGEILSGTWNTNPPEMERSRGIGGAPNRASTLPTEPALRKTYPIATGVLDYFPDALVAIAHISHAGNEQHNPGQPLHWARGKSADEADTMIRHFLQRGSRDSDGLRHTAKMAWRALALLQKEIENEGSSSL